MNKSQIIFEQPPTPTPSPARATVTATPTLQPKGQNKEWLQQYIDQQKLLSHHQPNTVRVGEVLSGVAFAYEKIRSSLEYKREHLLRRNAIERILRRLLWEKRRSQPQDLALALIRELIWSRYLENDSLPEVKIHEIATVIEKYLGLFKQLTLTTKSGNGARSWLLSILASEVEETIDPSLTLDQLYAQAVKSWFKKKFSWRDQLSEAEKEIQLFIAINRSLLKLDQAQIHYQILKLKHSDWRSQVSGSKAQVRQQLTQLEKKVEAYLQHPTQLRLYRFVQKQVVPFRVLRELIKKDPAQAQKLITDPIFLEEKVAKICEKKYAEINQKVRRGIARSIIYIFATKVLLAILLEFPYERWILGQVNHLSMAINVSVPPALMFLIGLTVKQPGPKNTQKIIGRIKEFVFPPPRQATVPFSLMKVNKSLMRKIFYLLYLALFIATFGGIILLLKKLTFNLLSAGIFFTFLSLVLLFGFRVRSAASELTVTNTKMGFLGHLLTNLSLPFLNLGFWLSQNLARLNFLIALMDFLIEAPLKSIIEVVDEWTSFIRERQEEVVEVPEA